MADVIFEKINSIGFVTLNRSQALNSMNTAMFEAIYKQLQHWDQDPQIAVIVFQGAGEKGFCAGGDVKEVTQGIKIDGLKAAERFFTAEYRMDESVYALKKPVLALTHGITMGGGLGLIAGTSCKVVTENTLMAMPEITIGFFADVGASYFLNKLPDDVGLYLALTATRLNYIDAIELGLAHFFVPFEKFPTIRTKIVNINWTQDPYKNQKILGDFIQKFSSFTPALGLVRQHLEHIQAFLQEASSLEKLHPFFLKHRQSKDPWIATGTKTFLSGSPLSAVVMLEQFRRGKTMTLSQCFQMEYKLALKFCEGPNFAEGVRAQLIDKDKQPKWQPADFSFFIANQDISAYF